MLTITPFLQSWLCACRLCGKSQAMWVCALCLARGAEQGCQMKISMKSQTMLKRPEKDQTDCLKAKNNPNFVCGIAIPLSQKNVIYKDIKNIFFQIRIKSRLALYWSTDLPWLFVVCEITHFGQNGATVCMLIHRQLSARKSLPFTPVLTIRIIRALPLPRNYRVSIVETQTCLQALILFSTYNIVDTTQCSECTHFQWLRKNLI